MLEFRCSETADRRSMQIEWSARTKSIRDCFGLVANLKSVLTAYHTRIGTLEEEKYDREYEVARKELEVRPILASSLPSPLPTCLL